LRPFGPFFFVSVASDTRWDGFFIAFLLRQFDALRLLVTHLHPETAARRRDGEVAVAESSDEVEGLSRGLLERKPERVFLHVSLDCLSHLRRCAEEAVGWHETRERLVRSLEVVRVDEEREPPLTIGEVRENRPRQKLVPERLPKPLDFPERLRVLRPALHVPNVFPPELRLEFRAPAPRRVLPALVRQDFPRVAVGGHAPSQRLHHERRPLMVRQGVRDDEARVVVHETDQVEPLVAPQQEGKDVRLPELVGSRSLEAPGAVLVVLSLGACLRNQPLLVQDPPHVRLAHPESLEA
jgi:hypothetical protein